MPRRQKFTNHYIGNRHGYGGDGWPEWIAFIGATNVQGEIVKTKSPLKGQGIVDLVVVHKGCF